MTMQINVLAIDDDKFIQKVITKSLNSESLTVLTADNGELGIEHAIRDIPDIILLDIEMPGINGYEVCDRLRSIEETKDIPIIFLSSHSSLRERMQGYEVGGDDYLIKPFEKENLLARVRVLVKYHNEREELRSQYKVAQQTAITAITGVSELALVIRFLEKINTYHSINDLAQGLLETTEQFSIDCCALIIEQERLLWYSSENTSISPLEKELIEMCDKEARFLDFGNRTIVNYPKVSLLVKDMPLEDMERYGRIKDFLPLLLAAVNSKISALSTQEALISQSTQLFESFKKIRSSLFYLGTAIVKNRNESTDIMNALTQELSCDFLRMGLEEDQEDYLQNRIDSALENVMKEMDAGFEIRQALSFIRKNLSETIQRQEQLYDAFMESLETEVEQQSAELNDNVELF